MSEDANQLALIPAARGRRVAASVDKVPVQLAAVDPVAQVRIDSPLPQLDRVFDYTIPLSMDAAVQPGVRVRVRFAGRLMNGFVVGRVGSSVAGKSLRPLERVISAEVVLTPAIDQLVQAVAEHYAGTFSDVVRSAVPPRHARAEAAQWARDPAQVSQPNVNVWSRYVNGPALIHRLSNGEHHGVRGVWSAAPGGSWAADIEAAALAVLGRPTGGVIVVVPDSHDIEVLRQKLADVSDITSTLSADSGPERRYREFLRVLRGSTRLVIGTRGAVFAPMADLALLIVWDDLDDSLWEPHAPYWNAREVAALRSKQSGCALLVGSPARSVETALWCAQGWAQSLSATRECIRLSAPQVRATEAGDEARDEAASFARLPHVAWLAAKDGLRHGPVLIQVPRRGYVPAIACRGCRAQARCACGGSLEVADTKGVPVCSWCGARFEHWACPTCSATQWRTISLGVERTAEDFGRSFPGETVIWSQGSAMRRSVAAEPALVIATPGAEPAAPEGYEAIIILDARYQLHRPHLQVTMEAARRWFAAALLARPRGKIVITADQGEPVVQAITRWDAAGLAERELQDRFETGLIPISRMAALQGQDPDIDEVLSSLTVRHRVRGRVEGHLLVAVDGADGAELSHQLREITATRAAARSSGRKGQQVNIVLDPRQPA